MARQPCDQSGRQLVGAVRGGCSGAFGTLYRQHREAAYRLARQLVRSAADADDLVSATFMKVLVVLRRGGGPDLDGCFRSYLLTVLRHTAYDKCREGRAVVLTDDVATVAPQATAVPFQDTVVDRLEQSFAVKAFSRLPVGWRTVLRYTEIDGRTPADLATVLGLTANGVAALSYRAREGLRRAYVQQHVGVVDGACKSIVDRFGSWLRGAVGDAHDDVVRAHLGRCRRCRELADEVADVAGRLARSVPRVR
ncbi:sigma-70 family RNA polymerase sigma factor [Saccharothrix sp. NPDC042600]|uniref:sigma-70 family RNA polymerase sigma factor n=1 Tax=Saccharothrix TaxID=2071 RepID=UPI0033C7DC81